MVASRLPVRGSVTRTWSYTGTTKRRMRRTWGRKALVATTAFLAPTDPPSVRILTVVLSAPWTASIDRAGVFSKNLTPRALATRSSPQASLAGSNITTPSWCQSPPR